MTSASERPLPQTPFYSIEYPGYVQGSSVPLAVESLGGQSKLDHAFRRATSKPESILELSLRPSNPFAHQISGEVAATNNILFRVVKKKRKDNGQGEYTIEAVGVIHKTVRFRGLVDFQYQPNAKDNVACLRTATDAMDADALRTHRVTDTISPSQSPEGDLRLFPPPLFSRQIIPQGYNFKANPASVVSATVNEAGEEKKRMINRMRWKGFGPATIMFSDKLVPEKPPQTVEQGKDKVNQDIFDRLQRLFAERSIWTRMSLLNQFSVVETREIMNSKLLLPLVCYVFQDGPWRDTLVRFGYDPRKTPGARLYQRLYFRNANHPIERPSVTTRRQERAAVLPRSTSSRNPNNDDAENDRSRSYIFDGRNLTKETAAFQLCDIEDPMLKEMIEDPDGIRDECDERDGWYTTHAYERIKMVLRHKFFSLLEGHIATDEECHNLLTVNEGSLKASATRTQKLRAGKHNMAKGALRPEDAAAVRLRAALDRNARSQYRS
ncbi:RNA polymerase III transcription factor (TF)IIIC subunit domain containing protein [Amanita muscaria]